MTNTIHVFSEDDSLNIPEDEANISQHSLDTVENQSQFYIVINLCGELLSLEMDRWGWESCVFKND